MGIHTSPLEVCKHSKVIITTATQVGSKHCHLDKESKAPGEGAIGNKINSTVLFRVPLPVNSRILGREIVEAGNRGAINSRYNSSNNSFKLDHSRIPSMIYTNKPTLQVQHHQVSKDNNNNSKMQPRITTTTTGKLVNFSHPLVLLNRILTEAVEA